LGLISDESVYSRGFPTVATGPWGLYIFDDEQTGQRCARVRYGRLAELKVPEAKYRASGYAPYFDELPSKEEFDGRAKKCTPFTIKP
jgi:hypothetical protein